MSDNTTMVKLSSGEEVREFSIEHAEGLINLNIRGGSGWKLADEGFELISGRLTRKAKKETKKEK